MEPRRRHYADLKNYKSLNASPNARAVCNGSIFVKAKEQHMSKHYYIADNTQPRGFVGISESEFLALVGLYVEEVTA